MSKFTSDWVKNLEKKRAKKLPKRYGGFMPCMNEHALKDQIVAHLNNLPEIEIAYSQYNGAIYDPKIKRYRKFKGVYGKPDVEFITASGMVGGIECKKDKGTLSKEQREWGERLHRLGCIWFCAWSFEQFEYEWEQQKHKLIS